MKQQVRLPTFAQEIKLTFHSHQHQPSSYQHFSSNKEKATYILQTIKMGKKIYSFVLRHWLLLYGFKISSSKINQSVYQMKLPLFNGYDATFSVVFMEQITVEISK